MRFVSLRLLASASILITATACGGNEPEMLPSSTIPGTTPTNAPVTTNPSKMTTTTMVSTDESDDFTVELAALCETYAAQVENVNDINMSEATVVEGREVFGEVFALVQAFTVEAGTLTPTDGREDEWLDLLERFEQAGVTFRDAYYAHLATFDDNAPIGEAESFDSMPEELLRTGETYTEVQDEFQVFAGFACFG